MADKDQGAGAPALDPEKVVIADLGSMSEKRLKKLKKGKGKGWRRLSEAVADLRADGHGSKVVVVLVKERRFASKLAGFLPF